MTRFYVAAPVCVALVSTSNRTALDDHFADPASTSKP